MLALDSVTERWLEQQAVAGYDAKGHRRYLFAAVLAVLLALLVGLVLLERSREYCELCGKERHVLRFAGRVLREREIGNPLSHVIEPVSHADGSSHRWAVIWRERALLTPYYWVRGLGTSAHHTADRVIVHHSDLFRHVARRDPEVAAAAAPELLSPHTTWERRRDLVDALRASTYAGPQGVAAARELLGLPPLESEPATESGSGEANGRPGERH